MMNIDKFYYTKTINSTAEGYFHSCKFPCASQYVLELRASSVTTDMGTAMYIDAELKTFAKHLRKTRMYKQQAKDHFLNLLHTLYIHVNLRYLLK